MWSRGALIFATQALYKDKLEIIYSLTLTPKSAKDILTAKFEDFSRGLIKKTLSIPANCRLNVGLENKQDSTHCKFYLQKGQNDRDIWTKPISFILLDLTV